MNLSSDYVSTYAKVYIWPGDDHCGGLATVIAADSTMNKDSVMVKMEEIPGVWFNWREIVSRQDGLSKYGDQKAQMDNPTLRSKVTLSHEEYEALIHTQRMLDEAITELRANGDCPTTASCQYHWTLNSDPPEDVCRKCWFDYLDAKAKEDSHG